MTRASEESAVRGSLAEYHHCTRRVSVSLLYIAPLLTAHEIAIRTASPSVRNAAELNISDVDEFMSHDFGGSVASISSLDTAALGIHQMVSFTDGQQMMYPTHTS